MPSPNETSTHDRAAPRPDSAPPFPPRIEYPALSGLPVPVQVVVSTATLPLELAVTSVKLLKNVESLLGELTFHLRALRPAVSGISQAYVNGQFDAALRTIDQIQHSTSAIAFVWAPFNAVRDVIVPAQPKQSSAPRKHPSPAPPPALAARPVVPAPSAAEPGVPSMAEWLGGLSGIVLDQAATLPGGGLFARAFRRPAADADPVPEYELVTTIDDRRRVERLHRLEPIEPDPEPQPEPVKPEPSLLALASGPIRKLFGHR